MDNIFVSSDLVVIIRDEVITEKGEVQVGGVSMLRSRCEIPRIKQSPLRKSTHQKTGRPRIIQH